ncbi:MAG: FtsX-like permease family protein [Verrucomicrobiota bacterium]|nr:FtsX-like permease family protein [Verrucomicrobiota bacterium]
MNTVGMALREMRYRIAGFLLALLAVAIGAGAPVGSVVVLRAYDLRTEAVVRRKEEDCRNAMAALNEDMRKDTLKLGFNLLILPQGQNLSDFYSEDFAAKEMPEEYGERLVKSGAVLVQHILPNLQQKLEWPEIKRTIILVGTRGEAPKQRQDSRKPLAQPVPAGTIALGHELHTSLSLNAGDTVKLMGREFKVHACHPERGSKDDITAWIPLKDAQELLGKPGRINSILALECLCAIEKQAAARREIMNILPDAQVVEMGTKILARAESRLKAGEEAQAAVERVKTERARLRGQRENLCSLITALALVACVVWVAMLALQNVNARQGEIGALRALGLRSRQILLLAFTKALCVAALGEILGAGAGALAGRRIGVSLESVRMSGGGGDALLIGLGAALALSVAATWIPAVLALRKDPAVTLRGQS